MSDSARGPLSVAIIGAGEMGAAVGRRMRETGARVITTLKGRGPESVDRATRAGLEVIEDDDALVRAADFILSIVPPHAALDAAERFRAPLASAQRKPVFVECNAVSPATVRRIADALESTGCTFIDAGIIGGPPPAGRLDKGPRFYASGANAHLMTKLRDYGLDIAVIDAPVGAASALKMSYAGLTKGLIALGTAMISAATRNGLAAELRAELTRSQPEMLGWLGPRVPGMFPKAYRWVAEMEEIAQYLGDAGRGAEIYDGIARLYERIAADRESEGDGAPSLAALSRFLGQ
jgi:L-threonate 2-dehydrogenase